jgi:hypothetical protein
MPILTDCRTGIQVCRRTEGALDDGINPVAEYTEEIIYEGTVLVEDICDQKNEMNTLYGFQVGEWWMFSFFWSEVPDLCRLLKVGDYISFNLCELETGLAYAPGDDDICTQIKRLDKEGFRSTIGSVVAYGVSDN